jgi:hypothetical protein
MSKIVETENSTQQDCFNVEVETGLKAGWWREERWEHRHPEWEHRDGWRWHHHDRGWA